MGLKTGLKKGVRPYTPLSMKRRGVELIEHPGMTGRTALIVAVVVMLLCWFAGIADAATINYMSNNVTGSDDYVPVGYGGTVVFEVAADEAIASWTWYDNGGEWLTGDELTLTFTTWGYHNISVYGTTGGGVDTNMVAWRVWVDRQTSAIPAETMNETPCDTMKASIEGEPSFEMFLEAVAMPYTTMIGTIFFLFISGVPLMMMYIRQDSMAIPVTIMFLTGSMMLFMLPAQWKLYGGALMALGLFGALYKLYKERER